MSDCRDLVWDEMSDIEGRLQIFSLKNKFASSHPDLVLGSRTPGRRCGQAVINGGSAWPSPDWSCEPQSVRAVELLSMEGGTVELEEGGCWSEGSCSCRSKSRTVRHDRWCDFKPRRPLHDFPHTHLMSLDPVTPADATPAPPSIFKPIDSIGTLALASNNGAGRLPCAWAVDVTRFGHLHKCLFIETKSLSQNSHLTADIPENWLVKTINGTMNHILRFLTNATMPNVLGFVSYR